MRLCARVGVRAARAVKHVRQQLRLTQLREGRLVCVAQDSCQLGLALSRCVPLQTAVSARVISSGRVWLACEMLLLLTLGVCCLTKLVCLSLKAGLSVADKLLCLEHTGRHARL